MAATQEEGIARYLKACRHDIAHRSGSSEQDDAAWITAHQAEAVTIYNDALQARLAESGDGIDAAEHAFVAVKRWAQGPFFVEIAQPA